jgi:hypothetical protein
MVRSKRFPILALLAVAALLPLGRLQAQPLLDVSTGSYSQDYLFATLALGKQLSGRLQPAWKGNWARSVTASLAPSPSVKATQLP